MKKKILVSIAALLLLVLILGLLEALVVPKYITNPEGLLTGEYYADAGGHDVIFVGDCEAYESVVPSVLWKEYGITSYVRGGAQQLVWHSYYLLEETFKYESPKAVVFNVYALKYGEPQSEAYNRMTLDGMKWSGSKIKGILSSMTEEESFLDYVFPLLRFHSRITELTADDLKFAFTEPPAVSHSGYLMQTDIVPMPDDGRAPITVLDGLPDSAMEYLEKMRLLCEENGAELILIKAPTNHVRYWWYDQWEEQICEYAREKELSYYNFIPLCEEIGIDWSADTYDEGMHLNVYGAEKLSVYFGDILAKSHGVPDRRSDAELCEEWQGRVERYYNDKNSREIEK